MKYLVVVESPGKIATVTKYLNGSKLAKQNGNQYIVKASGGHLMNLHPKNLSIDVNNNYNPTYVWATDAFHKKMMGEIKTAAKECNNRVIIASDMDLEGENIGYTICKLLDLKVEDTPRLIFRAITATDLEKALSNPSRLDLKQIDAQKTRRILDRLIGWTLSPLACAFIGNKMSIGRVQSIMTKLVVEREIELEHFTSKLEYKVSGIFVPDNNHLVVRKSFLMKENVKEYLESCVKSDFIIKQKEEKEEERLPKPPFITSTLQTEICRKFGISAKQVMSIAQTLYEKGVISYPRTDSVKLPPEQITKIGNIIKKQYGEEYHKSRQFTNKTKGAQEAHACIYPTNPSMFEYIGEGIVSKVYEIIHRRCIASQMVACKVNVITVVVNQSFNTLVSFDKNIEWYGKSENILFDGWKRVYSFETQNEYKTTTDISKEEDDKNMDKNNFVNWHINNNVTYKQIVIKEHYTIPSKSRYNDSTLISKMKDLGVGRPSTYGIILEGIEKRGYIQKVTQKGEVKKCIQWTISTPLNEISEQMIKQTVNEIKKKYIPTDVGRKLVVFIDEHFTKMFEYGYTSKIEENLNEIETGKIDWTTVLEKEYGLMMNVIKNIKGSGGIKNATKTYDVFDGKRYVGIYKNKHVYAFQGKFGSSLWLLTEEEINELKLPSNTNKKIKGEYIKLNDINSNTVTIEDIDKIKTYPIMLGELDDNIKVLLQKGPYGEYLKVNDKNISLPEGKINLSDWEIVKEYVLKKIEDGKSLKKIVNPKNKKQIIEIYNGQYGFYFKWEKLFVNVSSDTLETLDWNEAMKLYQTKKSNSKTNTNTKLKTQK